MSERNFVSVGLIGLQEAEQERLARAFDYSLGRRIAYMRSTLGQHPQILLVNTDDTGALVLWRRYRDRLPPDARRPISILVTSGRRFNTPHTQLGRPLLATRIIGALDQVSMRELDIDQGPALAEGSPVSKAPGGHRPQQAFGRALVVDDSLPVRIQMDRALRPFAAHVDFAETGDQARQLLDAHSYDIIFLDVVLPGADGYEICRSIKSGAAKHIPVIMLTGNSSPADRIKGQLAGCDTYLIKPVGHNVFQSVVEQYLEMPGAEPRLPVPAAGTALAGGTDLRE